MKTPGGASGRKVLAEVTTTAVVYVLWKTADKPAKLCVGPQALRLSSAWFDHPLSWVGARSLNISTQELDTFGRIFTLTLYVMSIRVQLMPHSV